MPSTKVWKSACESSLWNDRLKNSIEWEYYRKQHIGGEIKIIKSGECSLVDFFKNWSPRDISDLGLIRLSDLVIKSMSDGQLYEYNVTANRDLIHKVRGRISRRLESRTYDEWLKIKVLDAGIKGVGSKPNA